MSARPRAHATLLSKLVAAAPARLTKKLDTSPRAAEAWAWATTDAGHTVTTDTNETVTLRAGTITDVAQVTCTCLLTPRCFHVLATLAILDVDDPSLDGPEGGASPGEPPSAEPPELPSPTRVELSVAQREAAEAAFLAVERVLVAGATGAGAVLQGELLRAAHGARSEGLPRLGSAALRACRTLRGLREERPEVGLRALTADLRELVHVAQALRSGLATSAHVGVARRSYETLGNLVLGGLVCEPVIGNGYAGVVTTVYDTKGRLFTVRDVMPGDPSRARAAYGLAVRMGDTSLPHDELVRDGLFVEGATVSPDFRLGAGQKVKAARRGPTSLEAAAPLFAAPLEAQLARVHAAFDTPSDERPEAADMLFLEIEILGSDAHAVHVRAAPPLAVEGLPAPAPRFLLVPTHDAPELAYLDNLRLLGRARGLRVRLVARVLPDRPGALAPLLIAPPSQEPVAGAPSLELPPAWSGRVCVGLDRMQNAHVVRPARSGEELPFVAAPPPPDPLAALRRRVERFVLGGARTMGPGALRVVDEERRALARAMMPHATNVLGAFAEAAASRRHVAPAWLALAAYESHTTRCLLRAALGG